MKHSDFAIGGKFACGGKTWLVTDVGTRTVIAIDISPVRVTRVRLVGLRAVELPERTDDVNDWRAGPPYAVAEHVFDEDGIKGCEPAP